MDINKVKDLFGVFVDFLLSMLKGVGVIKTDEDQTKADAYTGDFSGLVSVITDFLKK